MILKSAIKKIQQNKLFIEKGEEARAYQDMLIKPKGSLGLLEDISIKLAQITGEVKYKIDKKEAIIMCGDHGFAHQGVSAYPKEVTQQMTKSYLNGRAGASVIARANEVNLSIVDVGIDGDLDLPGLINEKIKNGTNDFTKGPAMTVAEAVDAIKVGIKQGERLIRQGAHIIAPGEMGIGGTTASSALISVFSGLNPEQIVDRGTLINDGALKKKITIVNKALAINNPNKEYPLEVLAKVGGLEIAGIVGIFLAAALHRIPVVVDGVIASSAALTAKFIAPGCENFMFASHKSVEKGHKYILDLLNLKPLFDFKMRLGEASGAMMAMHIIQTASKLICQMDTFEKAEVTESDKKIQLI